MPTQQKRFAPESLKTKRTREKLLKHWGDVEKLITPEALQQKTDEIHRWIARHAPIRIPLKNKNFSLFDENQNAARISQKISAIAQKICEELQRIPTSAKPAKDQ